MTGGRSADAVERLYGGDHSPAEFEAALTDGTVPVGVYGLGEEGLSEAVSFASLTGNAIGAGLDGRVVRGLKNGSPSPDALSDVETAVSEAIRDGSFRIVANPTVVAAHATVHVVVPPSAVAGTTSRLAALVEAVAAGLTRGDLVCVATAQPPGTGQSLVAERLTREGSVDREAYGFAYCPEWTGVETEGRRRIVAGRDCESRRLAATLYELATGCNVVPVADVTTAERLGMIGELSGLSSGD